MRWLIDARTAEAGLSGGVARVSRMLCDAVVRGKGENEVTCVTTGWKNPSFDSVGIDSNHLHIRYPNKVWSAGSILRISSLAKSALKRAGKCDAAFFPNIGFTGRITIPYTALLHDLSFLIEPRWFSKRMRAWHYAVRAKEMIKNANHLFSVSETTKKDAVRLLGIPGERITVIPIGKTMQEARSQKLEARELRTEKPYYFPYVMTMGAGDLRKNTSVAIEAVRELRKNERYRDLHLVVLGDRPLEYEPWMIYESDVSDKRLCALYKYAKAFLYPSWYEGYGLPLHEAYAQGVRIIASPTGALSETAPLGTYFADPAKLHHWVEGLSVVLSNLANPPRSPLNLWGEELDDNWKKAGEIILAKLLEISSRQR